MFGHAQKSSGLLFATHDLSASLQSTVAAVQKEVDALEANRLLSTASADLRDYFVQKYRVEAITLFRDGWDADVQEVKVDVRHDPRRWISDSSRPALVAGERTVVRIPYSGDVELFYSRPDTYTSSAPRATVEGQHLVLTFTNPSDSPRDVRPDIDRALADIEQYLNWQSPMISRHNAGLASLADSTIQARRDRLLAQSQRASSLGIPIRQREGAPQTYAVPTVLKKGAPTLPPAPTSRFEPEPVWAIEQYEHALKIMQSMALVMERSPDAFKSMDEESLRQHFLVQLNGQFEGKATGETFNMAGKTDILLREGERNVFIAECKIWKGPKVYGQAIDQLLGYATWRDSKAAILVFNRGTDMSTVLEGIDTTTRAHAFFKRAAEWQHASGFRYVIHSPGDANRELTLTVLVFHVPR